MHPVLINRLAIASLIFICIVLGYVDLSFISKNIASDSGTIMELRDSLTIDAGPSYKNTALIFHFIPKIITIPLVLLISAFALIVFMRDLRQISTILIAAYITLPAIILFLTRPQKETIVIIMTMIVLLVFRSNKSQWLKISTVTLIYILYAVFMRQYYFLIIAAFLALCLSTPIMHTLRISWGVLFVLYIPIIIIVLLILPDNFFLETQGKRDVVNQGLGYFREARTGFFNPLQPDNGWNFIINYIYAFFRLNFPIFFTVSYKEVLHMISVFIFARLLWIGLEARRNPEATLCAKLLISHVLVLLIFEPDLGSYLRHLTSVFLYLTPMLILRDQDNYRKITISS